MEEVLFVSSSNFFSRAEQYKRAFKSNVQLSIDIADKSHEEAVEASLEAVRIVLQYKADLRQVSYRLGLRVSQDQISRKTRC